MNRLQRIIALTAIFLSLSNTKQYDEFSDNDFARVIADPHNLISALIEDKSLSDTQKSLLAQQLTNPERLQEIITAFDDIEGETYITIRKEGVDTLFTFTIKDGMINPEIPEEFEDIETSAFDIIVEHVVNVDYKIIEELLIRDGYKDYLLRSDVLVSRLIFTNVYLASGESYSETEYEGLNRHGEYVKVKLEGVKIGGLSREDIEKSLENAAVSRAERGYFRPAEGEHLLFTQEGGFAA